MKSRNPHLLRHMLVPLGTLLALALLYVGPAPAVYAAMITVTTINDELNSDGDCSLREAIRAANLDTRVDACRAGSGADIINLSANIYRLRLAGGGENAGATGDLDVTGDLTIQGVGASETIIDGNEIDRVFEIQSPARVTIAGVTIRNGIPREFESVCGDDSFLAVSGGGISNCGTLTLNNSVVRGNRAEIDGAGIANGGVLTLNNSAVRDNRTIPLDPAPDESDGGGIWNSGMATLNNSLVVDNTAQQNGGGIENSGVGTLTLIGTSINRNTAQFRGGGIDNLGASVTIQQSTLGDNRAGEGGGIWNNSSLDLRNSIVRGNRAVDGSNAGGGIYNNFGTLIIRDSTIGDNRADFGGGIWNDSILDMRTSNMRDNRSSDDGGGLFNSGTATLVGSTVQGNTSFVDGGGINNQEDGELRLETTLVRDNTADTDGGGIVNYGSATLSGSTLRDNLAQEGGGIDNSGVVTMTTSTVSNNRTEIDGGGIRNNGVMELNNSTVSGNRNEGDGGGIINSGERLNLNNVTITSNTADSDGGGINIASGTVTIKNSILANNRDTGGEAPDCAGTLTSQGYNLIRQTSGCTIMGDITGNISGDPKLGSLADNGGPTRTHALQRGSPAIDAGSPALPGSGGTACAATDQRGVARPQDGDGISGARCDMGSYERRPSEP